MNYETRPRNLCAKGGSHTWGEEEDIELDDNSYITYTCMKCNELLRLKN